MKKVLLFSALFYSLLLHVWGANEDVKMFPQPTENMERFIVRLESLENESDLLVELMPGVMYEKDCNIVIMPGQIESKTVEGWGYSFYEVTTNGYMASTMMSCPADMPKKREFIYVRDANNNRIRYNSKLPLVVYVPKQFEVKYRVFSPSKTKDATKE